MTGEGVRRYQDLRLGEETSITGQIQELSMDDGAGRPLPTGTIRVTLIVRGLSR